MKRLLDESVDDLSRALLRAGAAHRPPVGGKLGLMTTLGVAGGLSLWAPKASAWLSSSFGKMTVLSAIVGTGAVVLSTTPWQPDSRGEGAVVVVPPVSSPSDSAAPPHSAAQESSAPAAVVGSAEAISGRSQPQPPPGNSPFAPSSAATPRHAAKPPAPGRPPPVRPEQPGAVTSAVTLAEPLRVDPAAEAAAAASDAPGSRRGLATSPDASPSPERDPRLIGEIRLLDRMRVCLERGDDEGFWRAFGEYRRRFPRGQLEPEVERLKAGAH